MFVSMSAFKAMATSLQCESLVYALVPGPGPTSAPPQTSHPQKGGLMQTPSPFNSRSPSPVNATPGNTPLSTNHLDTPSRYLPSIPPLDTSSQPIYTTLLPDTLKNTLSHPLTPPSPFNIDFSLTTPHPPLPRRRAPEPSPRRQQASPPRP